MTIQEAIKERHSVRSFKKEPIAPETAAQLESYIEGINKESGMNFQLIRNDPECFDTFLAHYGKFSNADNYIAVAGPKNLPGLDERGGYYGEKIVLFAQTIGLNTCWVGGTYGRGKCKATVSPKEKIVCVIAIGYGESGGKQHNSKPLEKICSVPEEKMPDWFKTGVEAALQAPTALNQQKFTISLDGGKPVIKAGMGVMTKIDLGIVKCNFEEASGRQIK